MFNEATTTISRVTRLGRRAVAVASLAVAVAAGGCGGAPADGAEGEAATGSRAQAAAAAPVEGWFLALKDTRRCAFPFCGGYWLYRLNHETMTCADGSTASRCYVARIDWASLGLAPAEQTRVSGLAGQGKVVIVGLTGASPDPLLRGTGELLPYAAFESLTSRDPSGVFAALYGTGIVCAKAPCFNIGALVLNHPLEGAISGLDLRGTGATAAQRARAMAAMRAGVLVVAGDLREVTVAGSTTKGLTFFASQAYTRVVGGCRTHADCAKGGVCDRTAAHLNAAGRGVCIDPAKVVMVGPGTPYATIGAGIAAAASAGKTHVRVPAGTFTERVVVKSGRVVVAGEGAGKTILRSTPGSFFSDRYPTALMASGTGEVTVQGATITGGAIATFFSGRGVYCITRTARVALVEVEVSGNNFGIVANSCGEFTLRRSRVVKNTFAVNAKGPKVTIANTLIADNTSGLRFGVAGLTLGPVTTLDVHNVTIANNKNGASIVYTFPAGLHCTGSPTLVNAIVWGNRGGKAVQQVGCTFKTSTVEGGAPGASSADPKFVGATDYHLQPTSPAIDAGTSAGAGSIDLDGKPRVQGGRVDQGAYEMK